MRRALAAALALSVLAVPSCTAEPAAEAKPCDLTIATGTDLSGDARQDVLDAWNADPANTGAQACFVVVAGSTDDQHSEMRAAAQAGSGRFDAFNLDIQAIPSFAAGGHLVPIDVSLHGDTGDFYDKVWKSGKWDGTQYGVPFNSDAGLLFYRSDLTTPPGTWGELRGLLSGTQPRTRFAGQFAAYEGLAVNALEIIRAHGGELADDDGDVLLDDPKGIAGIQALIDAVRPPVVIPRPVLEFAEDQALREFKSGDALFMRNWPYAYRVLAASRTKGLAVTMLPWRSVLGGQYLAVSAYGRQQGRVQRLIQALTGPAQSAMLYRCGGFAPARASAFDLPRPRCEVSPTPVRELGDDVPELSDGVLERAIQDAVPRPKTPYYLEFSRTFQTGLHALLACHSAVERTDCRTARQFVEEITPRLESALTGR
ncbi:extracellular solute-binding protein [Streptosporangium soli]|nr:extracellular solute-binding protein [Streptosporangium sp. KLBMP 9127]